MYTTRVRIFVHGSSRKKLKFHKDTSFCQGDIPQKVLQLFRFFGTPSGLFSIELSIN